MNTRALLAGVPLALALLVAGCNNTAAPGSSASPSDAMSSAMMEPSSAMSSAMTEPSDAMSSGAMMSESPSAMATDKMSSNGMIGSYVSWADYSANTASYSRQRIVLFFHASWCPDCKASDDALVANPAAIPAGVTIVKVDYDSAVDLRRTYGVTMQHTFVLLDSSAHAVKRWAGVPVSTVLSDLEA